MSLLTADDLLRLDSEGVRGELIRGVLHETMGAGGTHGEIVFRLGRRLGNFVEPRRLGRVFGSDTGVWLERAPDTVREPDIGFISAERLPLSVQSPGYYEVVPDLVVEIVSPSDTRREVHEKALMWLGYGALLVWVVVPDERSVDVYRQRGYVTTLGEGDELDGLDALPGFTYPVSFVFLS